MKIKWVFYASLLLAVCMNGYAQRNSWGLQLGSHYMLEGGVRIRSEPNLQGSIIGRLELHEKIEILENAENEQQIGNVWAYWYKIRHNDLVGYIWGGYTSVETLVVDIDGNGQDDYFQYRISKVANEAFSQVYPKTDLFIYINDERMSTANIQDLGQGGWPWCSFKASDNQHTPP